VDGGSLSAASRAPGMPLATVNRQHADSWLAALRQLRSFQAALPMLKCGSPLKSCRSCSHVCCGSGCVKTSGQDGNGQGATFQLWRHLTEFFWTLPIALVISLRGSQHTSTGLYDD
jgi:hypothetical protein